MFSGRVRALLDERGKPVKEAGPAIPVQVLGLTGVPMAGDQFVVVEDASEARDIAQRRERLEREARSRRSAKGVVTLEEFMAQAAAGETRQLKLLIKADQGGPAEALADALQQLSTSEVQVEVVHRVQSAPSRRATSCSPRRPARSSSASTCAPTTRRAPPPSARASTSGCTASSTRRSPMFVRRSRGCCAPRSARSSSARPRCARRSRCRASAPWPAASCAAAPSTRSARVRVIRDGVEIYDGVVESLRRFKDDVREVREGFECGIGIENFNDVKVGDVFECYRTEEVARTLESSESQG